MYTLYVKPDCVICEAAKMVLSYNAISYTIIEIEKDITREELMNQYPTLKAGSGLPIVAIDGNLIGSYPELLKSLGYPETIKLEE